MKKINPLKLDSQTMQELQEFIQDNPLNNRRVKDWDNFRNTLAYKKIINALEDNQHSLCAYCENKLRYKGLEERQIEHFHPKSDINRTIDWMFDPSNFLACCLGGSAKNLFGEQSRYSDLSRYLEPPKDNQSCGQAKGNQTIAYNPADASFPIQLLFKIDRNPANSEQNGALRVHTAFCNKATNLSVKQLENLIEILNLNCLRLRQARSRLLDKLEEEYNELDMTDEPVLQEEVEAQLLLDQEKNLPDFFSTVRWFFYDISGGKSEFFLLKKVEKWV